MGSSSTTLIIATKEVTESQLILASKNGDRKAQKALYDQFVPNMYGVCRRYVKQEADVEEVLLNGFFKAFKNLDQYSGNGSFEGWLRKIMVNEALMYLRSLNNKSHLKLVQIDSKYDQETGEQADDNLAAGEILLLLDELPLGYRTVFNLYAIEGFSHKEIAEKLKVSVNTSKSQLLKARRMLQDLLRKNEYKIA